MTATKKAKTSLVVSIVSAVLSVATILGLAIGIGNSQITTVKANANDFKNGAITETGKIVESNESAVLKEMATVEDMKIEVDEETCTITYKVAFYDEEENFITATEDLSEDFDVANVPENAKFFRVMVTPNEVDGEAVKLNVFNRAKYLKQITVSYARE